MPGAPDGARDVPESASGAALSIRSLGGVEAGIGTIVGGAALLAAGRPCRPCGRQGCSDSGMSRIQSR